MARSRLSSLRMGARAALTRAEGGRGGEKPTHHKPARGPCSSKLWDIPDGEMRWDEWRDGEARNAWGVRERK